MGGGWYDCVFVYWVDDVLVWVVVNDDEIFDEVFYDLWDEFVMVVFIFSGLYMLG